MMNDPSWEVIINHGPDVSGEFEEWKRLLRILHPDGILRDVTSKY